MFSAPQLGICSSRSSKKLIISMRDAYFLLCRSHLRDLLQVADEDDGFEMATINNEDEDDNAVRIGFRVWD